MAKVQTPERRLVGLKVRTNTANEMNPETSKIGNTVATFKGLLKDSAPQTTYCVYTDYESDFKGDYTFFIGCASEEPAPENLSPLTLPAQQCLEITTARGPMPHVVVQAWQEIWAKEEAGTLGGERLYKADFEVYAPDEMYPENMQARIFIGIAD